MCQHARQVVLNLNNEMSKPHLNAAGGKAVPRPVFLILLTGNSHNHFRDHMIRKKAMWDDSVGSWGHISY